MKLRLGPNGRHLFDRRTGLNILFDETLVDESAWSRAPRQISIALTNLCDLHCQYCYAPKHRATLDSELLTTWLVELDQAGCLGVGFGGGEPTLHPKFAEICRQATMSTQLAITFTTHGHRLTPQLLEHLTGNVHFIRVSVDGVGQTYEAQRGRRFRVLLDRLRDAGTLCPLGINVVVNERTVSDLDALVEMAHSVSASELLLLPQQATGTVGAIDSATRCILERWVLNYRGNIRLAVSEAGSENLPICEPSPREKGLMAYAHIDASGMIKASSYSPHGVSIEANGVVHALTRLKKIMESGE